MIIIIPQAVASSEDSVCFHPLLLLVSPEGHCVPQHSSFWWTHPVSVAKSSLAENNKRFFDEQLNDLFVLIFHHKVLKIIKENLQNSEQWKENNSSPNT